MKEMQKMTKAEFAYFVLMAFASGVVIGIGGVASLLANKLFGNAGRLIGALLFTVGIYAIVMFFIFSIKYKRVASYVKMLRDMQEGIKAEGVNTYVRTDSSLVNKDGVDFVSLVVLSWSEKKQEYYERHILFDIEKPLPDLKKGDVIKHVTHANILMSYELASDSIFE